MKKVTRDAKRELLMQQAILWDDGCKVQTLVDEGYQITTVLRDLTQPSIEVPFVCCLYSHLQQWRVDRWAMSALARSRYTTLHSVYQPAASL